MDHIKAVNNKARRIEAQMQQPLSPAENATEADLPPGHEVMGLESRPPEGPHIPLGCTFLFSPGWETDSRGSTAGLCQPVERDLFDCHLGCFWPTQVPDQLNHAPDWTARCAAAQKDWRNVDLVFP